MTATMITTAIAASAAMLLLGATLPAQAADAPDESTGSFAAINGQRIFYSVHGTGKPLVLLHGGVDPDSFGSNREELARGRQVIAVHLQGHGHTPDSDRPLSSAALGDDVAALIGYLKLGKADVMGYSLGAGAALQTALRHPEVVDRLVVVSAALRMDGFYPEGMAAFEQLETNAAMLGESVKGSPLGQTYPKVDWTTLFRKIGEMARRPDDLSELLASLRPRTLLVFADADAIRPEHVLEFWRALGGGQRDAGLDGSLRPPHQLAIVPGTTHYNLALDPLLPTLVERFLGSE